MTTPSTQTYRILDAAANRASEGLRVVEDYARFGLNDAHLSRLLKECRHELVTVLTGISPAQRLAARDTLGDVGTAIGTATEYQRGSVEDVACASFKRVQEALRTLEEFSKLIGDAESQCDVETLTRSVSEDGASVSGHGASSHLGSPDRASSLTLRVRVGSTSSATAQRFEQLRYRLYTAEKAVLRTRFARERLFDQRLYLLVTASACHAGCEPVVRAAMTAGVKLIQMREKSLTDRELVAQARRLRAWTRDADALLIVNDRPDIAVLAEADGVHLGQDELTVSDARRIIGPDRLIGVSTHTMGQARQAVLDGADYLGVGPTFPSGTKSFESFAGLDFIRQVAAEITLPWFAIGGIDPNNLAAVLEAGASRIAVSGAILTATDPHVTASGLFENLPQTPINLVPQATMSEAFRSGESPPVFNEPKV